MSVSYTGPLIDAHHHLWALGENAYPWLEQEGGLSAIGDLSLIREDYLPEDYERDLGSPHLVASVHVEALHRDSSQEITWLDRLDKAHVAQRYIVGADLEAYDFADTAQRFADHPRVAGVRSVLSWHPQPDLSFISDQDRASRPQWLRGAEQLSRRGLILELMMYPYQADQVFALAHSLPELRIIVNHCGSPIDRDEVGLWRWRDGLALLAERENIFIKASNPGAYVGSNDQPDIVSTIQRCIGTFGYSRVMFGSDLPVSKLNVPPASIIQSADLATGGASADEKHAFFFSNAKQVYQIQGGLR